MQTDTDLLARDLNIWPKTDLTWRKQHNILAQRSEPREFDFCTLACSTVSCRDYEGKNTLTKPQSSWTAVSLETQYREKTRRAWWRNLELTH